MEKLTSWLSTLWDAKYTEFGGDVADVLNAVYSGEYLAVMFAIEKTRC